MSRTILTDVDGWTPIIDSVKQRVGLYGALVFGRMWRFCQMEDRVCRASLQTIADDLGVSRSTVIRYANELVVVGFLEDMTPDEKQKPHEYADTGKAGLRASISGVSGSDSESAQATTSGARGVSETLGESLGDTGGVSGSDSKIVLKKEVREGKTDASERLAAREAIQRHYDLGPLRDKTLDRFYQEARKSLLAGADDWREHLAKAREVERATA